MAENRYLPLTGGIALTTVYALTCYTVITCLYGPPLGTEGVGALSVLQSICLSVPCS